MAKKYVSVDPLAHALVRQQDAYMETRALMRRYRLEGRPPEGVERRTGAEIAALSRSVSAQLRALIAQRKAA